MTRTPLSLVLLLLAACVQTTFGQTPPPLRAGVDVPEVASPPALAQPRAIRVDGPAAVVDLAEGRSPAVADGPSEGFLDHVADDLDELGRTAEDLVRRADTGGLDDARVVAREASRAAKLARSLWSTLQSGRSDLPKLPSDPRDVPRPFGDAADRVRAMGRLVDGAARALREEDRARVLDASRRVEIVGALARVNEIALGLAAETTAARSKQIPVRSRR